MNTHILTAITISLATIYTLFTTHGAAVAVAEQPAAELARTPASQPTDRMFGMWVWRRNEIGEVAGQDQLLAFARQHGFNRLLVQIHLVPGSSKDGSPQLSYPEELGRLVERAAAEGIAVEALMGEKDMADAANQKTTLAILDEVLKLNARWPKGKRFAGIHYDIEPYLMPGWKQGDRPRIMNDVLTFLVDARKRITDADQGLTLAFDIPFWLDNKTAEGDSCILEFAGQTKNFHEHIQDLTDYVGIMSYRRHATGRNSIVYHCEAELAYAKKIGKRICAGMETGPGAEAAIISFHGLPPAEFWKQLRLANEALNEHAGYGGILVDSYSHLRNLIATGE